MSQHSQQFGDFQVKTPGHVDSGAYGSNEPFKGYAVSLPHQCDTWDIAGEWYLEGTNLEAAIRAMRTHVTNAIHALKYLEAQRPCERDTDGDGNCGQKGCIKCHPENFPADMTGTEKLKIISDIVDNELANGELEERREDAKRRAK